jgi:hypothetical protein
MSVTDRSVVDFELHWNGESAMMVLPVLDRESSSSTVSVVVDVKAHGASLSFPDLPSVDLNASRDDVMEDLCRLSDVLVVEVDSEGMIVRGYDGAVSVL